MIGRPNLSPAVASSLALAGALLLILVGCHRAPTMEKPTPPPGEVWITPSEATEADLATEPAAVREIGAVRTSGRMAWDDLRIARVFSPVDGRIVSVSARVGQHVKKGAALAAIDSPEVRRTLRDVIAAKERLTDAGNDFKRTKDVCKGCGSTRDQELAEDNYRRAEAHLYNAQKKARLLSPGSWPSDPLVLRAPIDGEVLARNVDPGPVLAPSDGGTPVPLFVIGDQAQLSAIADISARDLSRVEVGQKVTAKLSAPTDKTFEGKVDWVSTAADPATGAEEVRCTLPNPMRELQPDMLAALTILTAERKLAVPRFSVVRQGDETVVFVRAGPGVGGALRFERRVVEVDEDAADGWVAVRAGVEEGEQVVRSGAVLLSKGSPGA